MKRKFYIFLVVILIFGIQNVFGQVISESFEGGVPPTGWTTETNSGSTWGQSGVANTGSYSASYRYNSSSAADSWLISNGVVLTGGVTYDWSFFQAVGLGSYPERMKFTVGTSASSAGQTTTLLDLGSVSNTSFTQRSGTFTPSSSGTYYFGFHCYSAADQYYLYVDDFVVESPPMPPSNDNCSSATTLTVNASCTAGTNELATVQASESDPACWIDDEVTNSVWYKFTATNTTATVTTNFSGYSNSDTQIGVYDFTTGCNLTATPVGCAEDISGSNYLSTATLSGLTIGNTYHIQVDGYNGETGTFCIQVTAPLINHDCSGAITLTQSTTCSAVSSSLAYATLSQSGCGSGTANDDVWFEFTALSTNPTIFVDESFDCVLEVFSGSCAGLTSLHCVDDYYGDEIVTPTGLTIGNTYYIRVYSYDNTALTGAAGNFDICVYGTPTNNLCSNAESMTLGTPVVGMTTTATDDGMASNCSGGSAGMGVWYYLVYNEAQDKMITLNVPTGHVLYVYTGSCGAFSCVSTVGSTNQGSNTISFMATSNFTDNDGNINRSANTYYVYSQGNSGAFTIASSSVLPVQLASFKGYEHRDYNRLEWVTSSELNTESHIIERSPDGLGKWAKIGSLPAAGNSDESISYQLEDKNPLPLAYYRLRSVDYDGTYDLSEIVTIERKKEGTIFVYPVPANEVINMQFNAVQTQIVDIHILDAMGRVAKSQQLSTTIGINTLTIPLSELANGVYMLTVDDGENIISKRIVKQ